MVIIIINYNNNIEHNVFVDAGTSYCTSLVVCTLTLTWSVFVNSTSTSLVTQHKRLLTASSARNHWSTLFSWLHTVFLSFPMRWWRAALDTRSSHLSFPVWAGTQPLSVELRGTMCCVRLDRTCWHWPIVNTSRVQRGYRGSSGGQGRRPLKANCCLYHWHNPTIFNRLQTVAWLITCVSYALAQTEVEGGSGATRWWRHWRSMSVTCVTD